jgi:hypothetical protein
LWGAAIACTILLAPCCGDHNGNDDRDEDQQAENASDKQEDTGKERDFWHCVKPFLMANRSEMYSTIEADYWAGGSCRRDTPNVPFSRSTS